MAVAASVEAWAEAKRLWQETTLRPGEIALRIGIHHLPLSQRARRESWHRPAETAVSKATSNVAARDELAPKAAPARRKSAARGKTRRITARSSEPITDQLMRLANRNLDFLEDQMEDPDGMTEPEDRERATKAIDVTTRIVDKLSELRAHDQRASSSASDKPAILAGADLERRRHEIADRLERILAKRHAAAGSGGVAG